MNILEKNQRMMVGECEFRVIAGV